MLRLSQKFQKSLCLRPTSSFKTSKSYNQDQEALSSNHYFQQMLHSWKADAASVHFEWQEYFSNLPTDQQIDFSTVEEAQIQQQVSLALKSYIQTIKYKRKGSEMANLDPLQLEHLLEFGHKASKFSIKEEASVSEAELDIPFTLDKLPQIKMISGFLETKKEWTLREIISKLQQIYCRSAGFQFKHIENGQEIIWLQEKINELGLSDISKEDVLQTFKSLCKNEMFNNFLKNKFSTSKRFGIEGCDTLISALDTLVSYSSQKHSVEHMIFGMPHRGRLNTLACVFGKNLEQIFAEFQEIKQQKSTEEWGNSGDVKYHLGVSLDKQIASDKKIRLSILANPSHLEAVDPVVIGTAKAVQDFKKDISGEKVVPILIHGDAAFSGQGIVYETLQMQNLYNYSPGGTIHFIVNNQIGFTTTPNESRTTLYCTDIAKSIGAPIFHVNADYPELVCQVVKLAMDYRMQFKKDVVIDIIGYRRYGHNELDQPNFTQPMMYSKISKTLPIYEKFTRKIIEKEYLTEEEIVNFEAKELQILESAYKTSKETKFQPNKWISKAWETVSKTQDINKSGIDIDILKSLGSKITQFPSTFNVNAQLKKIFELRAQSISSGEGIDMATAESLVFASLLNNGFSIRLSGQDVERGTFSHRHAVLIDQKTEDKFYPIKNILTKNSNIVFSVNNSHLSEFGALGFEYGYSISNQNYLTIWEAQFGDFANGAQVMIDNFISSGELKWGVQSGLVLLLPNGMDGQGPEHSSARMERYLQLSDDDLSYVESRKNEDRFTKPLDACNWRIINCSFSANYFHALRRQMVTQARKPLVAFTSKRLLRFKQACSKLSDFESNTNFQLTVSETDSTLLPNDQIRKVAFCCGQVYYDILEERNKLADKSVAIIRIEQVAPFPYEEVREIASDYPNAEFWWVQEENMNYGAFSFVEPRMLKELKEMGLIKNIKLKYSGRKIRSSPATGSTSVHQKELKDLLNKFFMK